MKFFKKTGTSTLYNSSKTLTELANMLETDKGTADRTSLSWGKDWPDHACSGYTLTYERYMSQLRHSEVSLLEIGICDKRFPYASSKMWLSYFENLDLYAMDNFWGTRLEHKIPEVTILNDLGINFVYADQGNFCDWDDLKCVVPNNFDFIVEDASHWPNHMIVSLWQAKDLLKSGGYYFMEDLQNPVTSRGKFRYDNSLLTDELLMTEHSGILHSRFLNDKQNSEVQEHFELVELVLDKFNTNYLAVFKKK